MLNVFQVATLISLTVNFFLGFVVFSMNPGRPTNRYYLVTSIVLDLWFVCLVCGSFTSSHAAQLFWIRQAHLIVLSLPCAWDLLRVAIAHSDMPARRLMRDQMPFALLFLFVGILAQTPYLISDVQLSATNFVQPIFGSGQVPYLLAWFAALGILISRYVTDLRRSTGIELAELQFVLLAAILAAVTGMALGHFIPMLASMPDATQLLPFSVIVLDGVIAYGIATRRIMSVSHVLRQATAYLLLAGYLMIVYGVVFALTDFSLSTITRYAAGLGHGLATLAVAFSMAPAHGQMQRVTKRLFITLYPMNMQATMEMAHQALLSIGTTDQLLKRFVSIAKEAAGTDWIRVLLSSDDCFKQTYPEVATADACVLLRTDPLVQELIRQSSPVSRDVLRHLRPTDAEAAGARDLDRLQASMAVGLHSKGALNGILLLGPRLSGKIYGAEEQAALQFFCDQIGVSVENARLYTELQNSKIYNDILLDSLVSGVVAANSQKQVTVFNREAQRVIGLPASDVVGRAIDVLPDPISSAISSTNTGWTAST